MNSFNNQLHSDENNLPTQDDLQLLMQMADELEIEDANRELQECEVYEPTAEDWADYEEFLDECEGDDCYDDEYDGQPSEYDEWQDYMGGDDWDHGQFDDCDW